MHRGMLCSHVENTVERVENNKTKKKPELRICAVMICAVSSCDVRFVSVFLHRAMYVWQRSFSEGCSLFFSKLHILFRRRFFTSSCRFLYLFSFISKVCVVYVVCVCVLQSNPRQLSSRRSCAVLAGFLDFGHFVLVSFSPPSFSSCHFLFFRFVFFFSCVISPCVAYLVAFAHMFLVEFSPANVQSTGSAHLRILTRISSPNFASSKLPKL